MWIPVVIIVTMYNVNNGWPNNTCTCYLNAPITILLFTLQTQNTVAPISYAQ